MNGLGSEAQDVLRHFCRSTIKFWRKHQGDFANWWQQLPKQDRVQFAYRYNALVDAFHKQQLAY